MTVYNKTNYLLFVIIGILLLSLKCTLNENNNVKNKENKIQTIIPIIDAGHGKNGSRCYEYKNEKYCEWEFTNAVANKLEYLFDSIDIYYIRTSNETHLFNRKLSERIKFIKTIVKENPNINNYVLFSIHANFHGKRGKKNDASNGTEILLNPNNYNEKNYSKIIYIAEKLEYYYNTDLKLKWRNGKYDFFKYDNEGHLDKLAIISDVPEKVYSIVTESGFISNKNDRYVLQKSIDKIAYIHYKAFMDFYKKEALN